PYAQARSAHRNDTELATAYGALLGKITTFGSIFEADWVIDVDKLATGEPAAAIKAYSDAYQWPNTHQQAGTKAAHAQHASLAPVIQDADLISYRNYLRAIFTGPGGSAGFEELLAQLENRFHPSLKVVAPVKRPANQILIPIVKTILQAATGGGYGFGLTAGAIPPQGTQSDRDYLDQLIALTGLSATELGLRYRLDLSRPD